MICITGFLCLLFTAWDWLKGLFIKEEPVAVETKPVRFHCHQCGEEYTADKRIIHLGPQTLMTSSPRECPHCGGYKTMPVMFEEDDIYEEMYQRLWEQYQTYKQANKS